MAKNVRKINKNRLIKAEREVEITRSAPQRTGTNTKWGVRSPRG